MNSCRKFLGTIAIALVLAFNQQFGSASSVCDSSQCVQETSKIKDYVDLTANPCDDFYQFACGTFLNKPNEKYKMWKNLKEKLEYELLEVPQEEIHEDDHKMVKAAKLFYRTCLDEDKILPDFVKTVKKMLEAVGGWPLAAGPSWNESNFDWVNASYELRRLGYNYDSFLELREYKNGLVAYQEMMRFSTPDLKTTPKVAKLFGEKNEEDIKNELTQTYHAFDSRLEHRGDPEYTQQTVEEIQQIDGDIEWLEYLNKIVGPKIHISETGSIRFPAYSHISRGFRRLAEVQKRYQANYMIWEAIRPLYSYVEELESQRKGIWRGEKTREQYCAFTTTKLFTTLVPNPLEVIKLRKHLSREKKVQVEKMASNIKFASIEGLNKINWIPQDIKQKYIEKLEDYNVIIGLSEDYFDDNMLDQADIDFGEIEDDATFFDFIRLTTRNEESLKYMKLKKDLKQLIESPYDPAESSTQIRDDYIYIPTVLCEEPFFIENRPAALNYASLGTLISTFLWDGLWREIRYDENVLKTCLLGKHQHETNDNNKTVEFEAVRMNVAQQIAQAAYAKSIKENGEDSNLVSIEYTPNQLFWISFGILNCEPTNDYEFVNMMRTFSEKELTKDIVSESLRLNPNFANNFNCPVDSKLNPLDRCKIF